MIRPSISTAILLALPLALGCGGGADAEAANGAEAGAAPPATAVEVSEAFRDTVVDAITATGGIEAVQQVALRPDIDGRVVALLFREGQQVSAGAPLVKIDDAELKAQVSRAEADRDLAKQAFERTTRLVEEKAAAPADLERAEAASRSAEASLDLLKVRLDRTVVRAPFAGVIGQRTISIGDYVTSQSTLLTISTVAPQRVVFSVPERYAEAVKLGQQVSFQVAALPGKTFTAKVDFVDPVVTLPARTITIKALAANPGGALAPGMFIDARLATERRTAATVVPEEAISPSASGTYVWVADQGVAVRRDVVLGVRTPGFVEIVSGVSPGELVVVGGIERLYPNAPVQTKIVERRPRGAVEG